MKQLKQIINFTVIPQIQVTDYKPIEGYELNPMPSFWDLIQMPMLDAIQFWLINNTKLAALSKFCKPIPPLRETVGYKQYQIDLDDIVELTSQLIYEYRRSNNGDLPTLMCIGHKQWQQIQMIKFTMPYNHNANLAMGNNDRSPSMWYRGMRVVLINSIDGIVLLGDAELSER